MMLRLHTKIERNSFGCADLSTLRIIAAPCLASAPGMGGPPAKRIEPDSPKRQVQAALTKSAPKPAIRRRKGIAVLYPDRIELSRLQERGAKPEHEIFPGQTTAQLGAFEGACASTCSKLLLCVFLGKAGLRLR